MKKAVLITLLSTGFFICSFGQKQNDQFILNGTISGRDSGLMYLYYTGEHNKRTEDSAVVTNGKFSFKGNIAEPTMAYIQLKEEKRNENNSAGFYIEPSVMNITLLLNKFPYAILTGSVTQNEYDTLQRKKLKTEERWKIVMDTLTEVNKRSNFQYQEMKDWVLQPYFAEVQELDYTFFKEHPQSYITVNMLRYYSSDLSFDSLQMYYDNLGEKFQKTNDGKALAVTLQKRRAGLPGSIAKNFSTKDIRGNKITLADFKGRYVLLDFWASWCLPCRRGNPHLRQLYSNYKSKGIEFISVSDDDQKPEAWKQAVANDSLSWTQVLRGYDVAKMMKDEPDEADISDMFGINSLPTKILINPEGKIIGRFGDNAGGSDEDMDKMLASIFNK